MTLQELHQTFENRARQLDGYIYLNTSGDKDLKQESLLAMWRGLQKDSSATDCYLRTRMRWRVRDVWKLGRSVDTHPASRAQNRISHLNEGDAEDSILAECIRDSHLPLDEQVINKVDSERFLNTLDSTDRAIVLNKLQGMRDDEVSKDLGMSTKRYRRVKTALRAKIEDFFACE